MFLRSRRIQTRANIVTVALGYIILSFSLIPQAHRSSITSQSKHQMWFIIHDIISVEPWLLHDLTLTMASGPYILFDDYDKIR